jgi:four helix bundle protein
MDKVQLQNRTKSFAIRVFKMVEKLPKSKGTEVITHQLIKASSSVAANYRAVCRAKSKADFINKLKIVEEESDESLFWLEFIADLELIHKKLLKNLIKEANELVSIFTAALKTSKTNHTRPATPFGRESKIPNRKS